MIDFILSHPWSCCMAWIIACFFGVAFIAAGTERDDEARADYHRDRAAEEPVGCGCPQWCEFYMVSIGAPGCGETFPRCELMRDLKGTI